MFHRTESDLDAGLVNLVSYTSLMLLVAHDPTVLSKPWAKVSVPVGLFRNIVESLTQRCEEPPVLPTRVPLLQSLLHSLLGLFSL